MKKKTLWDTMASHDLWAGTLLKMLKMSKFKKKVSRKWMMKTFRVKMKTKMCGQQNEKQVFRSKTWMSWLIFEKEKHFKNKILKTKMWIFDDDNEMVFLEAT